MGWVFLGILAVEKFCGFGADGAQGAFIFQSVSKWTTHDQNLISEAFPWF